MLSLRCFLIALLAVSISGCASGPVPERAPKDLRLSIRQLDKGTRYYNKGCFPKAAWHFQNAHERFVADDDLRGTADSLNSLANTYYRLNDINSAVAVYDEADALYATIRNTTGRIRALTNKSAALASAGALNEAQEALNRADALAKDGDALKGHRLKARAILKIKNNEPKAAGKLLEMAMREISPSNARQYASAQYTMGYLLMSTEQPKKAIKYLSRALDADRTSGDHFGMGQDLEALGECYARMEQHDRAVSHFKRSIKIFALLKNTEKTQQVSSKLVESADKSGKAPGPTLRWTARWLSGMTESSICR